MSVITQCLHKKENTNAYLSYHASRALKQNSKKWSNLIRSNIALTPDQIHQTLILKISNDKSVNEGWLSKNKF